VNGPAETDTQEFRDTARGDQVEEYRDAPTTSRTAGTPGNGATWADAVPEGEQRARWSSDERTEVRPAGYGADPTVTNQGGYGARGSDSSGADRAGYGAGDSDPTVTNQGGYGARDSDAAVTDQGGYRTGSSDPNLPNQGGYRADAGETAVVHSGRHVAPNGESARRQAPVHESSAAPVSYNMPGAATQTAPIHGLNTVADRDVAAPAVVADRGTVLARQKERFGGMKIGSGFFGWLAATGLAVLLLAIVSAAGVAFGVTSNDISNVVQQAQAGAGSAKTVSLAGAIVLLVILFVSYFCGGYVAARMARFSGVLQGLAVWLWAIVISAIIAALAAIAGSKYNILAGLNLPRIPVKEGTVTTVGLIAIWAAVLAALIGALLGGATGTRYHRRVDSVGFAEADQEPYRPAR